MAREFDNKEKGNLWPDDRKKEKSKAPDRTGTLNVGGVEFWISGWLRKTEDGRQYLSLAVQKKEDKGRGQGGGGGSSRGRDDRPPQRREENQYAKASRGGDDRDRRDDRN